VSRIRRGFGRLSKLSRRDRWTSFWFVFGFGEVFLQTVVGGRTWMESWCSHNNLHKRLATTTVTFLTPEAQCLAAAAAWGRRCCHLAPWLLQASWKRHPLFECFLFLFRQIIYSHILCFQTAYFVDARGEFFGGFSGLRQKVNLQFLRKPVGFVKFRFKQ
jgi:hypothetical protein